MKLLKKIFLGFFALLALILIAFLLGPRLSFDDYNNNPLEGEYTLTEVEKIIAQRNANPAIKMDNQEQILWADGVKKSEYSIVYLHGFSASHEEGAPMHRNIANRYGANLFLTRLPKNGLNDEEAFIDLTPSMMVDYAKEAVKIGKSIGNRVILLSCSTGSTLSAYLAAADPEIFAQIMFSPNFEMHDQTTKLLTKPWGLQLARKIKGGNYHEWNTPQRARPYWYHKYRLEGVVALQSLINKTMRDDILKEIRQPLFVGYFYKDETTRDFTVSTDRIMQVEPLISTPQEMKVFKSYPDGKAHVFISPFFNDNWMVVQKDVFDFMDEKLKMEVQW